MKTTLKGLLFVAAMLVLAVSTAQAAGTWKQVGAAGFSAGAASFTSLAIDSSGTLYVAYTDGANGYKASVMRFNGTSWEQVGVAGFSPGEVSDISLAVDGGTAYIAYQDEANSKKVSVMKFDGSSWAQVGQAGFAPGMGVAIVFQFLDRLENRLNANA